MSQALELSERTLMTIVDGTGATERLGAEGGPLLIAGDPESSTGVMRVFDGATDSPVQKVVWTKLAVPARGVTTCMIFAFGQPDNVVPHFTLDCSDHGNGGHAFHLDLAPRVELATHIEYMDEVFTPLTDLYESAQQMDGLSATKTTRRQYAMMSPWMLVNLATGDAFQAIQPTVAAYTEHWLSIVASGVSAEVRATVTDTDLAARERSFRRNLFSPEIDPVWGRVDSMIGAEAAKTMQSTLREV